MTDPRVQLQQTLGAAYTLERELGGGGMSRVYLAQETALGRQVVVKVIAPELAEGLSAERFAREVKLAARLQQANIVPVLTAGDAGGLPYYTMPFVDGLSLRARLTQGPIPLGDALSILRDVARALAYAHAQGVVHRDIKPENILLSGGAAVVTDFGIAKAISASRTLEGAGTEAGAGLTQTGSSIGTPAYMAPEQAVGSAVDHRADLYSWGVVAYELLAGAHPFAGKTSAQQLIAAHLAEMPVALAKKNPNLPPSIANLVMQCLQKDPAQRPASADLLVTGLASIVTPSGERAYPTMQGAVRSMTGWLVTGGVAAVVVLAVGLFVWKGRARSDADRSVVVIPFDNLGAPDDAYFADGVTDEIASQLARIPGMQVIARASVQQFRGSSKSPREIAQTLGADYALSGSVRWARTPGSAAGTSGETQVRIVPALVRASSGAQVWGEPFQERLTDVFKVQSDVAEQVALALSVTIGSTARATLRRPDSRNPEARDAQLRGRALLRQRGLANLRQAVTHFRRAIELDSTYARAWAGYSSAYGLLPVYFDPSMKPAEAYAEAERAARRAVALDSLLPEAQSALAVALYHNFQFKAALATTDRAIALDPSSALAYKDRAEILLAQGRVAEAEAPSRRAIALDPLVPVLHANLAVWLTTVGQDDSAIALAKRVVAMDPSNPFWQFSRLGTLLATGRVADAVDACIKLGASSTFCRKAWPGFMDPARRADGLAVLGELSRDPELARLTPPIFQAALYAHLGVPDSAFARLREALRPGGNEIHGFINSRWIAPLKSDPRWDEIVGTVQRQ